MNETMVINHNNVVTNNDIVYHLGDFSFGWNVKYWLNRLNGKRHILILGNHDQKNKNKMFGLFDEVYEVKMVKVGGDNIFLSHYAHLVWPQKHYGVYHLFGHSHGTLEGVPMSLDCGVDSHKYTPTRWEDLKSIIEEKSEIIY
jgi:calcineurin-like phosphoesterase family protein